jgi:phage-related protein
MAKLKKLPAVFYATRRGNEPVREWLKKLDAESRQIVGENIATAEFSWPIGMPLCRDMGKGLHEIRTHITNGRIARVLFPPIAGEMVLLHGFIKKTQKTQKSYLDLAIKRMKEYMS